MTDVEGLEARADALEPVGVSGEVYLKWMNGDRRAAVYLVAKRLS